MELFPLLLSPFEMDVGSQDCLNHEDNQHKTPDDAQLAVEGVAENHRA